MRRTRIRICSFRSLVINSFASTLLYLLISTWSFTVCGGSGGWSELNQMVERGGISLTLDSFMISSLSLITNSPSSASSPNMVCTSYELYLETNDAIFALLLGPRDFLPVLPILVNLRQLRNSLCALLKFFFLSNNRVSWSHTTSTKSSHIPGDQVVSSSGYSQHLQV